MNARGVAGCIVCGLELETETQLIEAGKFAQFDAGLSPKVVCKNLLNCCPYVVTVGRRDQFFSAVFASHVHSEMVARVGIGLVVEVHDRLVFRRVVLQAKGIRQQTAAGHIPRAQIIVAEDLVAKVEGRPADAGSGDGRVILDGDLKPVRVAVGDGIAPVAPTGRRRYPCPDTDDIGAWCSERMLDVRVPHADAAPVAPTGRRTGAPRAKRGARSIEKGEHRPHVGDRVDTISVVDVENSRCRVGRRGICNDK